MNVLRDRALVGNNAGAYRQLIQISDDIVSSPAPTALLLAYSEPSPVSREWDAGIAGIVEWRLTQKAAPLPEWLQWYGTGAGERWEPLPAPYEVDEKDVPESLRRRNVWIERGELESA